MNIGFSKLGLKIKNLLAQSFIDLSDGLNQSIEAHQFCFELADAKWALVSPIQASNIN